VATSTRLITIMEDKLDELLRSFNELKEFNRQMSTKFDNLQKEVAIYRPGRNGPTGSKKAQESPGVPV